MIGNELRHKLKLAAVDLDGTLLGSDGQISEGNVRAVQRLQHAGVQVMLASGRHYHSMQKFATRLPGVEWLVSCQGGELSDIARRLVLNREFLPEASARKALDLGRSLGLSSVTYNVDGIYTEAGRNRGLQLYTDLSGNAPQRIDVAKLFERPIFKIIWIGEAASQIDRARAQVNGLAATAQPIRTHEHLLEFMPPGVSKASALKIMATRLSLTPSEIIAFGDGENDVPMFEWAGFSVAMPHGWPAAIKAATYTAPPGPADTAFARGVDMLFGDTLTTRSDNTKRNP